MCCVGNACMHRESLGNRLNKRVAQRPEQFVKLRSSISCCGELAGLYHYEGHWLIIDWFIRMHLFSCDRKPQPAPRKPGGDQPKYPRAEILN